MQTWVAFFSGKGLSFLEENISLALAEDDRELTAEGLFAPTASMRASIRAKEATPVVGLPLVGLVLKKLTKDFCWQALVREGSVVSPMTVVCEITAPAVALLKAERVILNYICHLSGIAKLTAEYVQALAGTGVRLLDTRKTTPGLRWLEKYAVQMGGGCNHRMNLAQMLMLKDNHIDAAGSITQALTRLRQSYSPCPPIEVECRTLAHVREAVAGHADRIMLDNMNKEQLAQALAEIPKDREVEISGGVSLANIRELATIGPRHTDFISVGRLTHSAAAADFSMTLANQDASAKGA
ncbi:MAG: carboxylating nicotinate-nucleotide diphosphorylase [Desulfovibrio sp.]|nr:carboxylating nicotinate-nucleotide diphosphorylase [Desulfovibrio sp.]